jgi:hypothetical protein
VLQSTACSRSLAETGAIRTSQEQGMALALKSRAVSFAFDAGSFFLADGKTTVRVDVSRDLLARLGGPRPDSKAALVERLVRHRAKLAQIAAAKYDEGQYEPEVNVLVVRIAVTDVL